MQTTIARSLLRAAVVTGGAALLPAVLAQQAPASAPAAARPTDPNSSTAPLADVVQLSPFQVAADADRGYQALNTLSGTRTSAPLSP